MTEKTITADISPELVSQYLTENPTFFLKHENLLADLYLPHSSGTAVSLLERQVSILRERNIDMRKRVNEFLEEGQRNDVLFRKTTALVLNLLEARSLAELIKRLVNFCEAEFQVDAVQFTLFTAAEHRNSQCRVISTLEVERNMPTLLRTTQCLSGNFRDDEFYFLFGSRNHNLGSAIILPICDQGKTIAMLVLGSNDVHYFKAGMSTLFLSFIGDVISRLLPRYI